jgi:diaminopimelate decarboxylase
VTGPSPEIARAAREAVERFGSPLYLYDLPQLDADAGAARAALPDDWLALYSLKANGLPTLVRRIAAAGFGASCVSGGELDLAAQAGAMLERTALEGIGKSEADLARAARMAAEGKPLLWVSLESAEDAGALAAHLRAARGRRRLRQDVLVRLNPRVTPETQRGLAVGAPDSKFGVLADELASVLEAGGGPDGPLRWRGLHVHVGSQLGAVDAWRSAMRVALRVMELQRAELDDFDTLDMGGGFPVAYADTPVPPVARFVEEAQVELAELPPSARPARLAVEPGRSVVAGCGWLIGRVLHVRQREPAVLVIDAGMTELLRPALYGAEHPMFALTSRGRPTNDGVTGATVVRVDGPVCESTDTLGSAALPLLQRGDVVAIGMAGAYGAVMSSTYNGRAPVRQVGWDGEAFDAL